MTLCPDRSYEEDPVAWAGLCRRLCGRRSPRGRRCLLLAPPGEIFDLAIPLLEACRGEGRVCALLRGEPYLHGPVPPDLDFQDLDPGNPEAVEGPFDLALGWGSLPFIRDRQAFLRGLRRALRPGGRLALDLPAAGFQILLQACDPGFSHWDLGDVAGWEEDLRAAGFRRIGIQAHAATLRFLDLPALMQWLQRPHPLQFEGERGAARIEALRENLAEALGEIRDFPLVFRRLRIQAMR